MDDVRFPYYSGNIFNSNVLGHVSITDFVNAHKHPSKRSEELLTKINQAGLDGDKKLKNQLKNKLFAFTPSVYVDTSMERRYDNVKHFTGLNQLDFDGIDNEEFAVGLKEHLFHTYEHIVCAYLSPSRLGVKCLLRTTIPEDIEHYRAIYKTIEPEFMQFGYFDKATKNAILPLFISMDKDILYRPYGDTKIWNKEDWSKEVYVNLNDIPKPDISDTQFNDYQKKSVDIVTDKINGIFDNGHPQLRDAALVLGSRVGAGYLTQSEAEQLMEYLISGNGYLQKGIAGYKKTSKWAINEGLRNPKFY